MIRQLHWLPVSFRINFKILLLTFKAIHELAPSYFNDLVKIKPLNSRYRLWSNDGILLSHLNFKTLTTLGNRAFVATAPKFWNDLHLEIRMTKSVDTFKKFLNTHLFSRLFILSKGYLIPIHDNVIFTYFFCKTFKDAAFSKAFLFLVRLFHIIHIAWCISYLSFSYFYSMCCCNAQVDHLVMKTAQCKFLIIIRLSQKYNWQAKYQAPTIICYFFQGQRIWSAFLCKRTGEYFTPRLKATNWETYVFIIAC